MCDPQPRAQPGLYSQRARGANRDGRGQGGMLSDAAIIARERRIQTVVGVRPATERIHDGDILRVDGTSGYVKIIVKG